MGWDYERPAPRFYFICFSNGEMSNQTNWNGIGLWKASLSLSFHLFEREMYNQDEMWYLVIEIGDARSSWDLILFIQTWTKLLIRTELEIEFKFSRGFVSFHSTICGPCLSYIPLSLILTNQLKVVKTFNYCKEACKGQACLIFRSFSPRAQFFSTQ